MTRREHLRAWAKAVLKEGVERGQMVSDAPIQMKVAFLLTAAARDLKDDLGAVGGDFKEVAEVVGGRLVEAGVNYGARAAHSALDQALAGIFSRVGKR